MKKVVTSFFKRSRQPYGVSLVPIQQEELNAQLFDWREANRYVVFKIKKIGSTIQSLFGEMMEGTEKQIMFYSENHRMSVKLTKISETRRIIDFYDPQDLVTQRLQRLLYSTEKAVEEFSLDCVITPDEEKPYFRTFDVGIFAIKDNSSRAIEILLPPNSHDEELGKALYWFLCVYGGPLDLIFKTLETLDKKSYLNLVKVKNADGTPGLWMAMCNGHENVIVMYFLLISKCFREGLLKDIPSNELLKLLTAEGPDGTSGLWTAIHHEHTDAVKVYLSSIFQLFKDGLLKDIPSDKLLKLLQTENIYGVSGLEMALFNGDAKIIREYLTTIALLIDGQFLKNFRPTDLLSLITIGGSPRIQRRNVPVLFGALLAMTIGSLPETKGLWTAMDKGHAEAIQEFFKGILLLSPYVNTYPLPPILSIKEGKSSLWVAMSNGHANAVRAYLSGVLELFKLGRLRFQSTEELLEFIVAKNAGIPGLWKAMSNGHAEVVKEYFTCISTLVESNSLDEIHSEKLLALIVAKNASGEPGLSSAIHGRHTKTVQEFFTGLSKLFEQGILEVADSTEFQTFIMLKNVEGGSFLKRVAVTTYSDSRTVTTHYASAETIQEYFKGISKLFEQGVEMSSFIDELKIIIEAEEEKEEENPANEAPINVCKEGIVKLLAIKRLKDVSKLKEAFSTDITVGDQAVKISSDASLIRAKL